MGGKKDKIEAHRALYRKYRSKSLKEIVGQEHITTTLANAIKRGKISHAYLFTGPKGVGKTSIARILAYEINEIPYEDEKPHLDIIEIDAASNRRIDDIRELREKVHIAPIAAKYKIYIIDEVHMLTTESFNALLKTLEEPPSHVIFILATTEMHKLPATIVSRTQRHNFRSITSADIVSHLRTIASQESIQIDDDALELLAEYGDGSFRDSISLLDQLSTSGQLIDVHLIELLLGLAPKKQIDDLLDAARHHKAAKIMQITQELIEAGVTPTSIAMQLITVARKTIQASNSQQPEMIYLMEQLLTVSSAQYQRLKLETILLQTGLDQAERKDETQTPSPKPPQPTSPPKAQMVTQPTIAITPEKMKSNGTQKKAEKPKPAQPSRKQELDKIDITSQWPKLLDSIKAKNNSLYTILRLAKPILTETGLELAFGFEFHRKRIDDSKHKIVVATAFEELTGLVLDITTSTDKTIIPPASLAPTILKPTVDPAHASLVAGIQDMMGGGEVI